MTDLEMTKLCAEAMGIKGIVVDKMARDSSGYFVYIESDLGYPYRYAPLHDDAQAMALVKKFDLCLRKIYGKWSAEAMTREDRLIAGAWRHLCLNRAIVECVAKMEKNK